jgi:hypothetical protein
LITISRLPESLQIRPEDDEYKVNEQILLPADRFLNKGRGSDLFQSELTNSVSVNFISPVRNSDSESEEENSDYDLTLEENVPEIRSDTDDSEVFRDLDNEIPPEPKPDHGQSLLDPHIPTR